MTTTIQSNGSKWAGQPADPIEALLARLTEHPLDRDFEAYGNFIMPDPVGHLSGEPLFPRGTVTFWGNFQTISAVFNIHTDDPELIAQLTAAIQANQQRGDYLAQPPPFEFAKLEIIRHRFSTTQGEVELRYAGRRLEQYGDHIELKASGEWLGHPDAYWVDAARKFLFNEHEATIAAAWAQVA